VFLPALVNRTSCQYEHLAQEEEEEEEEEEEGPPLIVLSDA